MRVFLSNGHYYSYPLITETDDKTMIDLYNAIFSTTDQIRNIYTLYRKSKDPKFFQKLIFLLTGLKFEEDTAKALWEEIERYHKSIISVLGRNIHISATVVDYMFRIKNYLKNPSVFDLVLMDKIKNSTLQDFFTGLYKGSFFEDFVRREINRSKRHNHKFSIVLFVVNGVDSIYLSGNVSVATKIIVEVGSIVKNLKRSEDMGFRFSTNKFGIILPHTDKKGAVLFSRRLMTELSNSILNTSGLIFGISISLGIQSFPDDGSDVQTLISNVEKACYKAKIIGQNKIVYEL